MILLGIIRKSRDDFSTISFNVFQNFFSGSTLYAFGTVSSCTQEGDGKRGLAQIKQAQDAIERSDKRSTRVSQFFAHINIRSNRSGGSGARGAFLVSSCGFYSANGCARCNKFA